MSDSESDPAGFKFEGESSLFFRRVELLESLAQKIDLKCVLENLGTEYLMFALVQLKSILVPPHQSLGV